MVLLLADDISLKMEEKKDEKEKEIRCTDFSWEMTGKKRDFNSQPE